VIREKQEHGGRRPRASREAGVAEEGFLGSLNNAILRNDNALRRSEGLAVVAAVAGMFAMLPCRRTEESRRLPSSPSTIQCFLALVTFSSLGWSERALAEARKSPDEATATMYGLPAPTYSGANGC
jgi:hypothetical protein